MLRQAWFSSVSEWPRFSWFGTSTDSVQSCGLQAQYNPTDWENILNVMYYGFGVSQDADL